MTASTDKNVRKVSTTDSRSKTCVQMLAMHVITATSVFEVKFAKLRNKFANSLTLAICR